MAEIDHPCLRSALASTSSSRVNIPGGSFTSTVWTPPTSREPHSQWWNSTPAGGPGVGNFSERKWGKSVSVYRDAIAS